MPARPSASRTIQPPDGRIADLDCTAAPIRASGTMPSSSSLLSTSAPTRQICRTDCLPAAQALAPAGLIRKSACQPIDATAHDKHGQLGASVAGWSAKAARLAGIGAALGSWLVARGTHGVVPDVSAQPEQLPYAGVSEFTSQNDVHRSSSPQRSDLSLITSSRPHAGSACPSRRMALSVDSSRISLRTGYPSHDRMSRPYAAMNASHCPSRTPNRGAWSVGTRSISLSRIVPALNRRLNPPQ